MTTPALPTLKRREYCRLESIKRTLQKVDRHGEVWLSPTVVFWCVYVWGDYFFLQGPLELYHTPLTVWERDIGHFFFFSS